MNAYPSSSVPTGRRWERPLNFPPGYWKRQLPARYLELARHGDIDALRQLLLEHPDWLNKRGSHNRTFLWEAVRRGKLAAVKWLVDHGADLDATGCYNGESYVQLTPYCAAIYYRRDAIADYLRSRSAEPDVFRAVFLGDQARVSDLLAADPTLLNAEDPQDDIYFVPLLAFALVGGHQPVVEFLLQEGAVVSPYSAQLIYLAARESRLDLVELLVKYGADISQVDSGIFVAVPDIPMLRYLLDHGASAEQVGKNGLTPLIYAARGDKSERPDKIQLLLEYGASVNARGPKGRTALHYAAVGGHLKVIEVLLAHGADPMLRDQNGETALRLAFASGKTAAVDLLKRRGTNY